MNTKATKRRKRIAKWRGAYSYRIPMQIKLYMLHWWRDCYPICPRCEISLERDFLGYCYHCGQKLGWDRLNEVCFIKAGDKTRKIHGKRRVRLTVTRDENAERLYISIPSSAGRNESCVSRGDRTEPQDTQLEQLCSDRGSTECVSELCLAK